MEFDGAVDIFFRENSILLGGRKPKNELYHGIKLLMVGPYVSLALPALLASVTTAFTALPIEEFNALGNAIRKSARGQRVLDLAIEKEGWMLNCLDRYTGKNFPMMSLC